MVEEWVKDAGNDVKNKVHIRLEIEKALKATKEENKELLSKLIVEERERRSVEARLKNAQIQAKDQCKLLYQTEIELATSRQLVMDLKSNLQKTKEAAQLAKGAAEAERQASYLLGVEETHARLIEELDEVCKDYCNATWDETLNVAGIPVDSACRQPGSVFYHPHIREVPDVISFPPTPAQETIKQPLTTQTALPLPEVSKGPSQAGDQGQGVDGAKDKGKSKGSKPPSDAKDAAKAKEAEAKAKEAEAKIKEADQGQGANGAQEKNPLS